MIKHGLDHAEFSVGDKVSYWNGETFFAATVEDVKLDPIDRIVSYRLFYRKGNNRGRFLLEATPYDIKQSQHFKKD